MHENGSSGLAETPGSLKLKSSSQQDELPTLHMPRMSSTHMPPFALFPFASVHEVQSDCSKYCY